jgi:hypothetical protein
MGSMTAIYLPVRFENDDAGFEFQVNLRLC